MVIVENCNCLQLNINTNGITREIVNRGHNFLEFKTQLTQILLKTSTVNK